MRGLSVLTLASLLGAASFAQGVYAAESNKEQHNDPFIILPPGSSPEPNVDRPSNNPSRKTFTLRHIYHHGSHKYPRLQRYADIKPGAELFFKDDETGVLQSLGTKALIASVITTTVQRLVDRSDAAIESHLAFAAANGYPISLPPGAWRTEEIPGPNVTDHETVVTFAKIAANAYVQEPWKGDWQDVKGGFNYTEDFGWEKDGLRGHIFADTENKTVVIGIKGTSVGFFDGAETSDKDIINDNLFGSCCCGQGRRFFWKPVCDCMTSTYTCNRTCVVDSLKEKAHYYRTSRKLYHAVQKRYPDADIWLSGHSLGGVVSALLGLTYRLPTMTYEAFPDGLAASRLDLPLPPGYRVGSLDAQAEIPIYHYGHNADPIFTGTCNGMTSGCTIGGYAFESQCHTGKKCVYDTVGAGWHKSLTSHKILGVITDVIEPFPVPTCEAVVDCTDCALWKFTNGTATTTTSTSSTSTSTRTRTETCKTPGWWGCLDKTTTTATTTTTSSTTTTSTTSSTTTTCKTPGWFGCNDPITTSKLSTQSYATPAPTITTIPATRTTHPASPSSSSSTTCLTPGWLGCKDQTTASPTAQPSTIISYTSTQTITTCKSRVWFGLFCGDYTTTAIPRPTATTSALPQQQSTCVHRHWYGTCKDRAVDESEFKADLRR